MVGEGPSPREVERRRFLNFCYVKHLKVVFYLTDNTWAMLTKRVTSDVQSFREHKVDE